MPPQHSQKPFSLYKFSSKHLIGVRKKHLHCTIYRRPRTAFSKHFESNYSIFLYISLRIFCIGGWLNNFFNFFGLRKKCFTIFHFNWNIWKSNYFSVFRYISIRWTFEDNFEFKSNVTKIESKVSHITFTHIK